LYRVSVCEWASPAFPTHRFGPGGGWGPSCGWGVNRPSRRWGPWRPSPPPRSAGRISGTSTAPQGAPPPPPKWRGHRSSKFFALTIFNRHHIEMRHPATLAAVQCVGWFTFGWRDTFAYTENFSNSNFLEEANVFLNVTLKFQNNFL